MTGSIAKPFQKFGAWLKRWAMGLPNIAIGIILFLLATNIGGAALTSVSIVFMFVASGLVKADMPVKMYIKYFAELTICALLRSGGYHKLPAVSYYKLLCNVLYNIHKTRTNSCRGIISCTVSLL